MPYCACLTATEAASCIVLCNFNQTARRYDGRVSIAVTHAAIKLVRPPPTEGSLYDYAYVLEANAWQPWMDLVPTQTLPDTLAYRDITVTTPDVVRYTYMINALVQAHHPVLLVGPTGTGKSVYTKDFLAATLDKAAWTYMTFGFSAQTSVNMTQARRCLHAQSPQLCRLCSVEHSALTGCE